MGGPKAIEKMRCTILCLSLAIVYASAAPVDTVVPEDALYAQDDDFAEANNKIAEMQAAGASDKECRELTEKTKTDIKVVVENNQKIIDSLSTGQECHAEGQTEVRVATESLSKAKTTLTTAILTLTKAGRASAPPSSPTPVTSPPRQGSKLPPQLRSRLKVPRPRQSGSSSRPSRLQLR